MTDEQVLELLQSQDESDTENIKAVPLTIHLVREHQRFHVPDVNSWAHTDKGVFATGFWLKWHTVDGKEVWEHSHDDARDILIPYTSICYLEFDFESLKTYMDTKKLTDEPANTGGTV